MKKQFRVRDQQVISVFLSGRIYVYASTVKALELSSGEGIEFHLNEDNELTLRKNPFSNMKLQNSKHQVCNALFAHSYTVYEQLSKLICTGNDTITLPISDDGRIDYSKNLRDTNNSK